MHRYVEPSLTSKGQTQGLASFEGIYLMKYYR